MLGTKAIFQGGL